MAGARSVDIKITGTNTSLKRAVAESERSVAGLGKSVGKMNSATRSAGVGLAGIGGYAVLKGLKGALDAAGNFEQKLDVLKATSNATSAEMKLMSKTAIALGKDIKLPTTTALGAADAMLELSKGGLKAKEAINAAKATLLLSTAAQIDNATAAKAVVTALKTFNLAASKAKVVVDDFAGAANASVADMQDVTDALQMSGQGFKALGVNVGDASTAIAIMANAGQKGGVAGAALNVAMTKLAAPTAKAEKLMKNLGIEVFDSNGKFVGMRGAIENMTPIMDKMTEKQRLSTLAVLGGTRGMRALNIVLAGGVEQWDKTHKAVTRAGQAQDLANAQTRGYKGAVAALTSQLETLQLQLGIKMLPVATRFTRWLNAELPTALTVAGQVTVATSRIIKSAILLTVGPLDTVSDILHGRWSDAWKDAKGYVKGALDGIVGNAKQFGPAVVKAIESAASGAYKAALHVGSEIARGALEGVANLPGQLASKLIPGGGGKVVTKFPKGQGRGANKAGGGMVAGRYSDGDIHPHMLSGEEAVLNPTQIAMVGRGRVMSALRATGASTGGFGFAKGKIPVSHGGRVYPTGKAPTMADLVSGALGKRSDTWGLMSAQAQLRIARASAAGDANGNVAAYLAEAGTESKMIKAINAILQNPAKALGVKGAKLSKSQRTSLLQALASAITQRKSDLDTVYDLQHPAAGDDGSGGGDSGTDAGGTDPGTISADAQAQIDQLNTNLATARRGQSLSEAALGAFGSTGDIGEGGFGNAWQAAQGGPNFIQINTLHPGDPRTLSAVAAAATGGMALQPYVTAPRTTVNV